MYIALATSWALFSGPTHYISLATGAFFGIGGYFVGTAMSDFNMSFWIVLLIAPPVAAVIAMLIGLATLRLSGVYFVIFTLGLAEMIRNFVSWIQNNFLGSRGLYVLTDITEDHIYWMLLAVTSVIFVFGWQINRSRIGFALRIIGNDEEVAKHVGINTAWSKVVLFTTTGFFAALVGVIVAPRYFYIEPNVVFSPQLSFLVAIMALLGGAHRLWGPLVGVIPFTLIWEGITIAVPTYTTLFLGLTFLLIVYFIPNGFVGLIEALSVRRRKYDAG
jgi:branched-chain amino acid transport system permease protein